MKKFYEFSKETLINILLKYKSHLNEPIKNDFDFLNDFINFSVRLVFNDLSNSLSYISDTEIFLKVIETNKEIIIVTTKFKSIIMVDAKTFNEKNVLN